jgi:hypothetical protein
VLVICVVNESQGRAHRDRILTREVQMPDAASQLDVGISIDPAIDLELADDFAGELRSAGLQAEAEVRESSVYAGVEWLVPTAIVVFKRKNI